MQNHSLRNNHFFIFILFFILSNSLIPSPTYSQSLQRINPSELKQAALRAFAGTDVSQKKGPLAKIGFDLTLLREEYRAHSALQTAGSFKPSNALLHVSNNKVIVDVIAQGNTSSLASDLIALGMQITGKAGSIISGSLPIASLDAVASLQRVRFARPALWKTNIGSTTSQGDSAMRSKVVRSSLGYDGTGITIGVLSDSYNYLSGAAADITSGDLPGTGNPNGHTTPVNVLADDGTTDEGRAMLQLIHDVAPGASLAFATANGGMATFAENITNLRTTAGADVIVDDIIYFAEPMFQDGVIAQAVDTAVAAGVPYFSSAGNQAHQSYESVWRSGPFLAEGSIPGDEYFYGGTTFDFDPGIGVDNMQTFTIGNNELMYLVLQWDSPFASACSECLGSLNDLDFYILNADGSRVVASSIEGNEYADAVEIIVLSNTSGSTVTYNVMITKYLGDDPGLIKYVNLGDPQGGLEYATNSSTIYGHANAAGAEAVGAAAYYYTPAYSVSPPVLESFSSAGPTPIYFTISGNSTYDARADKPEITAPDGCNTTFFGFDVEPDSYPNFYGTSAAAPHAAAVAALMLEAKSTATPAQIYGQLEATAIDMGTGGFDNNSGYGLIQADDAVNGILPVELVSFTGIADGSNALLSWKTATETNNYGFEIERRTIGYHHAGVRNTPWSKIGFVPGSGNSASPKEYSFTERNLPPNRYVYRIKQVDQDGTYTYSESVELELGRVPKILTLSQNYPNPFNPKTSIEFTLAEDSKVSLKIYDMLGRELETLVNGELKAGLLYHEIFDASKLSSGTYIYRLQTGNKSLAKKLMILK